MTIEEWLQIGMEKGWCGPVICHTHDGLPTSEEEEKMFEENDDVCIHILRMYVGVMHRHAVEEFHSPSQWRKK